MSENIQLAATARDTIGKANRRLGPSGKLPAVVYGVGHEPVSISLDKHQVDQLLLHGAASSLIELSIDGGVIRSFAEKPQVTEGWINGGYFVFQKKAFELLDPSLNEPLETALLERLASMGELAVHHHRGFWQCMDTVRDRDLLQSLWSVGDAPWKTW